MSLATRHVDFDPSERYAMPVQTRRLHVTRRLLLAAPAAIALAAPAAAQDSIKLGLVAAMSGQSAKSGEAIVRGLSIAIDEINAKGGVLRSEERRVGKECRSRW